MKKYLIHSVLSIALFVLLGGCSFEQLMNKTNEVASPQDKAEVFTTTDLPEQTFQLNDRDESILHLQEVLQSLGYTEVGLTGIYEDHTKQAIKDFQAQVPELIANGIYDEATRTFLTDAVADEFEVKPYEGFNEDFISTDSDSILTVGNPNSILVLTNKTHALPDGFEPENLTEPDVRFPFTEDLPKRYIQEEAAVALEELFNSAEDEGITLHGQSGYRSYTRQKEVFKGHTERLGEKEARKVSALPGQSEHQTGLTMDITAASVDFTLTQDFGETKEGKWVANNAHKYGFIIRYLEGKEEITGYSYEPWHLRYVGKDSAQTIYDNDLTLEEYLGAVETKIK